MISVFERLVHRDIASIESRPMQSWQNLPLDERRALDFLSSDRDIIIREADKGGAIVILDREVYIGEVLRHLNDREFYQEIPEDPSKTIMKLIQTTLVEAFNLGYISETTIKSLTK